MNLELAIECAALCSLAYHAQPNRLTKKQITKMGYTDIRFFDKNGTQCFMARKENRIVVSIRGTEITEKQDVTYDGMFWPTQGQKQGVVHSGFALATDQIWDEVNKELDLLVSKYDELKYDDSKYDEALKVIFTGHSLGGAIAVVCAARSKYVAEVYTFGQPRVGNRSFTKNVQSRLYRIVNENDIVPRVPPGPLYRHQGQEYHLFGNKMIKSRGSLHSYWLWWVAAGRKIIKFRFFRSLIEDHNVAKYYQSLLSIKKDQ